MSKTSRKLTTIFCADVQNYTRLMSKDEEGTLETLRRYRDAMQRLIEARGGRVINTWGDGVFAEFPSVVEAVHAAMEIQSELAGYNAESTTDKQMLFRIGLNLGDVIIDGDDLYGDGVNIAARLQSRAAPGGIVISNTVYDQVRTKVPLGFDFLGTLDVKNVEGGVPSYAVRIAGPQLTAVKYENALGEGSTHAHASEVPQQDRELKERNRSYGGMLTACLGLALLNAMTWHGDFWAKWPILAILWVLAARYIRSNANMNMIFSMFVITATGIVVVNLFTWSGTPWAVWALIGLSIAAAFHWATRSHSGL